MNESKMGGMVAAIERGWVQREIEAAAYRQQQAVDAGETVVVGVNSFTGPERTRLRRERGLAQTCRRDGRTGADRARASPPRSARSPPLAGGPRAGHGAGPLRRQFDAGDPGGGRELRNRGRDRRKLAQGLRRIPANAAALTPDQRTHPEDVHGPRRQQGQGGERDAGLHHHGTLAQRERTGESVGENAVLVLKARKR